MKFEWDTEKNKYNIKKHALSFKTATLVFNDPYRLEYYDELHSDDEDRYITIGLVEKVIMVVFTIRSSNYRIISARPATAEERKRYNNGL